MRPAFLTQRIGVMAIQAAARCGGQCRDDLGRE